MKNKFIQGYLIGKSVEILVAGTALLIAKKKVIFLLLIRPNLSLKNEKKPLENDLLVKNFTYRNKNLLTEILSVSFFISFNELLKLLLHPPVPIVHEFPNYVHLKEPRELFQQLLPRIEDQTNELGKP